MSCLQLSSRARFKDASTSIAMKDAIFVHPDGRRYSGKRAQTAAAAFAKTGSYRVA